MYRFYYYILAAIILLSVNLHSQGVQYPGAPEGAEIKEAFPVGLYEVPGMSKKNKDADELQSLNPYATTVFTFNDIVVFSYFDNTQIEVYNSANVLVSSFTIDLDEYKVLTVAEGIYRVVGNKSYSVLVGDPISTYVLGYYAVNENGYGLSTKLNTYIPTLYSTDKFLIFAYQDNTEYTLKNLTTGVTISAGVLNAGQWYEYSGRGVFVSVTANKPVSALSYNDQGYMVPSNNGSFAGTKFYSYVGTVGGWTNGIIMTSYHNDNNITVRNLQTNAIIWQGNLNEGQVHAIPTNQQIFFSVESDKNITLGNHPYAGWNCCYAYLTRHIDNGGFGIGTLFYVPTIANRFDVFSFEDNNNVVITRMDNNQVIFNGNLNEGQGYSFTSVKAVYKVESQKNISVVTSNSGNAGADFMPMNYSTNLTDLSITSSEIFFNPDPVVEGNPIILTAQVNNFSQVAATDVLVRFYLGNPNQNGIQIGSDQIIPTLAANSNANVSVNWTVPQDAEGQYVYVWIDPLNTITESNESNNLASRALIPNEDLQPPLSIQINAPFALNISGNTLTPNPFEVQAVIFNNGTVAATNVVAEMLALPAGLELDPSGSPALINVGNIPGKQSATVTWLVIANGDASGFLKYSMRFDASNADEKQVSRQINVPDNVPPSAPTGLQVVSSENGTIVLSWNPNSEADLFGYELYYDNDGSGAPYSGTDADQGISPINVGNVTTYTLTGLDPNKVYYFALKAFDTRPNYSPYSNEAMSTLDAACPVVILSMPDNNTNFEQVSPMTIDFEWLEAEGAVHYQIQISTNSTFTNVIYTNTTSDLTHAHTLQNYELGSYWWRVRMWNGDDYCNFSPARRYNITDGNSIKLNPANGYLCKGETIQLGDANLIEGGSGDYSIFWHPAILVSDPNILNPFTTLNFTQVFTVTVFDNITGEMASASLTIFVNELPNVTGPFLVRHPRNTSLDLNTLVTTSGGIAPYFAVWYDHNMNQINDPTNVIPPVGARQYTVVVYDDNECMSQSHKVTIYVSPRKDGFEAVAGLNNSSLLYSYPNPVENMVEVIATFAEPLNNLTIKITDILGNEVYRNQMTSGHEAILNIDMSRYSSGVYMLVIDSGTDIVVKKLMKQ
ncbi:MAG: T9SS type A sorting domain-containing protein [Candidatus Kapabacteria bacterium]|nr:T9SS type A sorting domain-containing protein [Ignavibacteriota bacterium]MCW5883869.1 T9SS type A sorting domain-containing protein [Candidatus Kapabacteria bacterium]